MTTQTSTIDYYSTVRRSAPRLAGPIGLILGSGYAYIAAAIASVLRPRSESPADAALRLRRYANQFSSSMPGLAADLYAAADRHQGDN
jgi:hypothetical protein